MRGLATDLVSLVSLVSLGRRCFALGLAFCSLACAHEVSWTGGPQPEVVAPAAPILLTVAVELRSFEATSIDGRALTTRVAERLRAAQVFQGVMYPIPPGVDPLWNLELLVRDRRTDPNANFWKGALVGAVFPLAAVLHMEEDYSLEIEALLTYRSEIVATYSAEGAIRERYQYYSDENTRKLQALEAVVDGTTNSLMAQIAADASRLETLDRLRSGS